MSGQLPSLIIPPLTPSSVSRLRLDFENMPASQSEMSGLSQRGKAFASQIDEELILKVLANLWHPQTNPEGYVNLGVAENMLMHEELVDFMTKNFNIDSHALTYGDGFCGSHQLRKTIAEFITTRFKSAEPVLSSHVFITAGVTLALEACAFVICNPGDGVLLGRPYYGSFPEDLAARAGAQVVPVSFGLIDPFSEEAVDAYEDAVLAADKKGIKVRALLLCNPHNPLGRCYPRNVLLAYMKLCQKHQLHFISDEIYGLSVWENPDAPDASDFTSVLSIDPRGVMNPQQLHVLWGMSKDFGSNGLRLGCVINQHNPAFRDAITLNSYFTCPSAMADRMTATILSNHRFVESFMSENKSRLARQHAITTRFLESHGIPIQHGVNAGFFVWMDLFALSRPLVQASQDESRLLDSRLQQTLRDQKVFLAAGTAFGNETFGWFRIVFAHEKWYLEEGLRRIVKAARLAGVQLRI